MKILWLSHFIPYPPHGGALQRSYNLIRRAAQQHEVHLVSLNQRALLPEGEPLREALRHLATFCARAVVFRMPAVATDARQRLTAALSFFDTLPYEVNWLRSPEMDAYLRGIAATESFDLVHVDTLGLMRFARPFSDTPIVLNHHNVESQLVYRRAEAERNPAFRIYLRREAGKIARLERDLCRRAAVNLTVSDLDSDRLRAIAPAVAIQEVENGVDVDFFQPGISGRETRGGLIFAGSLNLYANVDAVRYLLNEIWPALARENPRRRLAIVGRNPGPEVVRAATDPRITVTGWVPDVRPFIDEASIYVCPIRDGGGTRLKVLDALAMGKPMVATALAVEGLGMVDGEHYLRAETPPEYLAQVGRLESDAKLCERLARSGRDLAVRRFSWTAIAGKLERAYALAAPVPVARRATEIPATIN